MKLLASILGITEPTEADLAAQIKSVLEASNTKTLSAACGAIAGLREAALRGDAATKELAALRAETTQKEIASLIAEAKAAGKVTPAMEPTVLSLAGGDVAKLKAFLDVLPATVNVSHAKTPEVASAAIDLTPEEEALGKSLGLSKEKLLKGKEARLGRRN